MTPQQALNTLYQAARLAPLNAESHELCAKAAQELQKALAAKEQKEETNAKTS